MLTMIVKNSYQTKSISKNYIACVSFPAHWVRVFIQRLQNHKTLGLNILRLWYIDRKL